MSTTSTHVVVNGVRIRYQIDGPAGAPWLTLVTGIANDLSMWDGQVPALSGKFRVLRYDLRGQGGSEATAPPYTTDLLESDLIGLWNALKVERSHLAGLGLGGSLVQGIAIHHPDRVLSLMPICCRARMVPEFAQMWHGLIAAVQKNGVESIVEQTAQRWFSDDFKAKNPQILDGVRAMIRATSKDGYLGCSGAFLTVDYEDKLGSIRAPTLYISGAEDKVGGPPALMAGLAARVLGARHVSVPGAAHIANLQNPAGFNAVLTEYLSRFSA